MTPSLWKIVTKHNVIVLTDYRYETAYACEGKTLKIECKEGELIKLIRANYGRFSITICNDHGNTDWSVNCMSPKSLRVLHSRFIVFFYSFLFYLIIHIHFLLLILLCWLLLTKKIYVGVSLLIWDFLYVSFAKKRGKNDKTTIRTFIF